MAHHIAWFLMKGRWPSEEIDHRNLDKSDNRWTNLRTATHAQNMTNVKSRSKRDGALKGAFPNGHGKWISKIRADGKSKRLGLFLTAAEAHAAYVSAAAELHGEFARAA